MTPRKGGSAPDLLDLHGKWGEEKRGGRGGLVRLGSLRLELCFVALFCSVRVGFFGSLPDILVLAAFFSVLVRHFSVGQVSASGVSWFFGG